MLWAFGGKQKITARQPPNQIERDEVLKRMLRMKPKARVAKKKTASVRTPAKQPKIKS